MSNYHNGAKLNSERLLEKLISRGDKVSINNGILNIEPASNKKVPKEWLNKRKHQLIVEILNLCTIQGYLYDSYTTGSYSIEGGKLADGITLCFENIETGDIAYAIYNVSLKRSRSTAYGKKGTPLPKNHFNISKRHLLFKFWKSLELPIPCRLSAFHDYMGKLKGKIYLCEANQFSNRIHNKIIPYLSISYVEVKKRLASSKNPIYTSLSNSEQQLYKRQPISPDKDNSVPSPIAASAPNQTTEALKYDLSKQGRTYKAPNVVSIGSSKRVEDQSMEEWLEHLGEVD